MVILEESSNSKNTIIQTAKSRTCNSNMSCGGLGHDSAAGELRHQVRGSHLQLPALNLNRCRRAFGGSSRTKNLDISIRPHSKEEGPKPDGGYSRYSKDRSSLTLQFIHTTCCPCKS